MKFNADGSFNIERNSVKFAEAGRNVSALKRHGINDDISIQYIGADSERAGGYAVIHNGSEVERHTLSVDAEKCAYMIALELWAIRRESLMNA